MTSQRGKKKTYVADSSSCYRAGHNQSTPNTLMWIRSTHEGYVVRYVGKGGRAMLKRWDLEDGRGVSKMDVRRSLWGHVGCDAGNTDGSSKRRTVRKL